MEIQFIIFAVVLFIPLDADGALCEDGWVAFKEELCFKTFPELKTYDAAKALCADLSSDIYNASLVIVKNSELQDFLEENTKEHVDNLWLGCKYDATTSKFVWADGGDLQQFDDFINGIPQNPDPDSCVEMRPTTVPAKTWADVRCRKSNLVMCQKTLSWSLKDAIVEVAKIQQQLQEVNVHLADATKERDQLREQIKTTAANVVPIGFIYVEYDTQAKPETLWPNFKWDDVTATYAGLFFRAIGEGADEWGETQEECAPRIDQVQYHHQASVRFPEDVVIPPSGWSAFGHTGENYYGAPGENSRYYMALRYHTETCGVRPKNKAIRIWKRTG